MRADDRELLGEIAELLKVPNFKGSIYHKVEELKFILKDEIDQYKCIMNLLESPEEHALPREHKQERFSLFYNGRTWNPSSSLPQSIIDYLIQYDITPGQIILKHLVTLNEITYEVTFEKPNKNTIEGFYSQRHDYKKDNQGKNPLQPLNSKVLQPGARNQAPAQLHSRWAKQEPQLLKMLFEYLIHHEKFYHYIMDDFLLRWKPLIDKGLFNSNCSSI